MVYQARGSAPMCDRVKVEEGGFYLDYREEPQKTGLISHVRKLLY